MTQASSSHAVLPADASRNAGNHRRIEDMVYQAVTVGAILLVLGTLWVF